MRGKTSSSLEELKSLTRISANLRAALDNFSEITAFLDVLDCNYLIDITSIRGFEYYTGLCFQFFAKKKKIGSGGRYDDLIPLIGGKNMPACGFALYIDPLIDLIQPKLQPETEHRILIRCNKTTADSMKASFRLADSIRRAGYKAELDFNGQSGDYPWIITVSEKPSTFLFWIKSETRKKKHLQLMTSSA